MSSAQISAAGDPVSATIPALWTLATPCFTERRFAPRIGDPGKAAVPGKVGDVHAENLG